MNAFINHFLFEFRTGIRNKTLLLLNYLFPLGFFVMMGLIMAQINPVFLETMIPAMAVFAILTATMLGVPDQLVTAREVGIFRSYRINGVPVFSILVIPALTSILHGAVVACIITVTAALFFDAPTPVNWLAFVVIFLVTAFACAGLAVLIGVISASSRVTVLWSQSVFVPSMMLSGMTGVPSSMLPQAMRKIAQLLPSTQAMNAFRGLAYDLAADFDPWGAIIVLLAGGVLALGLAIYLFNWDRRNPTQRGHPLLALLALLPYALGMILL